MVLDVIFIGTFFERVGMMVLEVIRPEEDSFLKRNMYKIHDRTPPVNI